MTIRDSYDEMPAPAEWRGPVEKKQVVVIPDEEEVPLADPHHV